MKKSKFIYTRNIVYVFLVILITTSCNNNNNSTDRSTSESLSIMYLQEIRERFDTSLLEKKSSNTEVPIPPEDELVLISYETKLGKMSAYITPEPEAPAKLPMIIWLTNNFDNSISELAWKAQPEENDQSASIYRKNGILMMYPSLRGGNKNPGSVESFYGEVDDIFSALKYASQLDYVDKNRIYLGGHGTGGTLAILAAEYAPGFRAVFSFGPMSDVSTYGQENLNFDINDKSETAVRSPILFLNTIETPTFVFESILNGNYASLEAMRKISENPNIKFYSIGSKNHFSILYPINELISEKINNDTENDVNIIFTDDEIKNLSE